MKVMINGESRDLPAGATVASVVELLAVAPGARGVAVAVNGEVVSRTSWPEIKLRDGSLVEVVRAIGGG